jgi:hypothetical protein
MYDRVLAHPKTPGEIKDMLRAATVIVADNVAEYYHGGTDQELGDVRLHFPNLAPPFPAAWIECRAPTQIVSCEHGHRPRDAEGPTRWAVLPRAVDRTAVDDPEKATCGLTGEAGSP